MNGMVIDDMLSDLFRFFTCIAVSLTLFYSRGYLAARGLFRGETFVLALTTLLGMMVMISAGNFITLYMGLELQALSLYAMVAMHRTSKQASEAAMKYFVLGALASGMLLYGMSMIYGATGSLDLVRVGRSRALRPGQPDDPRLRARVRRVGDRLQARRGALPHVGAGRVRRRADAGDAADRHGAQARGVRVHDAAPRDRAGRRSSSTGREC